VYKSLSLFGPNIVASEFDEWKRHRKVAAPSFNEKNNRLVYEETTRIVRELFQSWSADGGGRVVKVENVVELTSTLALMVISAAGMLISSYSHLPIVSDLRSSLGFGSRYGWNDSDEPPAGHKMVRQWLSYTLFLYLRHIGIVDLPNFPLHCSQENLLSPYSR